MEKVEISCSSCDADFNVLHDLNEPYIVTFCVFCGDEVDDELIEWTLNEED